MKKTILISSLLITLCSANLFADDACKEYQLIKDKSDSAKVRNKFLDVKNPKSNQAPAYLEDQAKDLEKKCNLQIAAAEKAGDKMMAQPKKEAIKINK